ncbi:MAG: ribosomal protein S18-alanine N-acetyltransferase [Clostridia bacterium]|nr:ribosomal protein S18-alanine N-acetyltransferase [Clostridia bacterium]
MILRPLNKDDIPFLVSARNTFPDAWDGKMLLSAFNAGNFYGFIAETDGAPIGFITYSVNIDTADLQDLFVVQNQRKKGVGGALIAAFIKDALIRGVKKLFLEVRESNTPAVNLYKKAGFTFLSVRKKYYSDGEDAKVYIKEL